MGKAPRRDAVLQLSPGCDLGCPLCERGPARTLEGGGGGGRCLTIRGRGDALAAIARARAAGWQRVRVHAQAPSAIDGADALLVPIASHVGLVHERITGQPLDQALAVLERKLDVDIEIEIPILPRRLSHPLSIVRLARSRARIAGVRLYAPRAPSPAPARWDEGGTLLCEVLDYCGAEELEASVDRGVPFCALRDRPDLAARHLRFDPRRPQRGPVEPPCDACACNE
ncbi:MAG: hypothetical protein IT378_26700, partial [Sandaracinaceae bacterium]|nr:hypothetical protein [Sandaracinaceae bacterium]